MLAPDIDPVAISFPAFQLLGQTFQPAIHWYGLMYLVGFLGGWWLGAWRARRNPLWGWRPVEVSDLVFYVMLGVILGGRLGYVLFYDFPHYLHDPLDVLRVWKGGMSFHGGLLGVLVAMWYYGRKTGRTFFTVTDFLAPLVPIGLGAGRIGNFINQELWGKVNDLPWGMIFKTGGPLPRHPSQLYEFGLEGVALFAILWLYATKTRPTAAVSGLFLIVYGSFRFLVEFVRQPDVQLGYLAFGWVTMGQILSLPMILLGAWLMWWAHHRNADQTTT